MRPFADTVSVNGFSRFKQTQHLQVTTRDVSIIFQITTCDSSKYGVVGKVNNSDVNGLCSFSKAPHMM